MKKFTLGFSWGDYMARRVKRKEKKKIKKWYKILAPRMFGEVEVGETISDDPQKIIGRTVETTVKDLTGDFTKFHIKLRFQVKDVRGENAYTVFKGLVLARDYVRSLIRRKSTRIEAIHDFTTKDGYKIRIRALAIGLGRAQTSQEEAIRAKMVEVLERLVPNMTIEELVNNVINGNIAKEIHEVAHKIRPLKKVEIRKIKVLEFGELYLPKFESKEEVKAEA